MKYTTTYTDEYGRLCWLKPLELAYFQAAVDLVLAATGISIQVEARDHDLVPGHENALGIFYRTTEDLTWITVDTYFIHERYRWEAEGRHTIEQETLVSVLCHELAHIRYARHTRHHAALTAHYIGIVQASQRRPDDSRRLDGLNPQIVVIDETAYLAVPARHAERMEA